MWVKICANTNLDDARAAVYAGADAVGFVFAKSKRQVTAELVADIVTQLPAAIEKVGVFNTDDPYEVEHFVSCCGLTAAQLHSDFDAEMVQLLSQESGGELKIIQTVQYEVDASDRAAADESFATQLRSASAEPAVWAILIDAAMAGRSGGLGVAFDWQHVGALLREAQMGTAKRVILAGGLDAGNVQAAIAALSPWGVDVASGVEASPGRKDRAKVRAFLAAAKG
jgi:phosphoribosylanthranilate isomerase